MKTTDIPQDSNPALAGVRKTVYAVDEQGKYTTAPSTGWTVEDVVTSQAAAEYRKLAEEALGRVRSGLSSPLEFHMYDRRLELPTMAAATGLWQWQVRRHLRPADFRRLSPDALVRYSAALGITVEALCRVPEAAP